MPTEDRELNMGKLLYKDQDGTIKELANYEFKEENNDDVIDAMQYATKGITEGGMSITLEFPKEKVRHFLKIYGLERITRKRFKKLLMGCGMQRNDAEVVANAFRESEIQYTSLAVQKVIETINMEAEKEEK